MTSQKDGAGYPAPPPATTGPQFFPLTNALYCTQKPVYELPKNTRALLDLYHPFWRSHGFTAVPNMLQTPQSITLIHDQLGYPVYFIPFIGVAKLLGCIAILTPGLNRIKEWAYAGLFFDLIASVYSAIAAFGTVDPMMLTMLAWFVPGILSYYYRTRLKEREVDPA
jgi:hypothetical protein